VTEGCILRLSITKQGVDKRGVDICLNAVFNHDMTDQELIKALGGSTRVAELLGYDKTTGGVQRVQNWIRRGIPAEVKLKFPHIFLIDRRLEAKAGV
jgi:hypothetical protein